MNSTQINLAEFFQATAEYVSWQPFVGTMEYMMAEFEASECQRELDCQNTPYQVFFDGVADIFEQYLCDGCGIVSPQVVGVGGWTEPMEYLCPQCRRQ